MNDEHYDDYETYIPSEQEIQRLKLELLIKASRDKSQAERNYFSALGSLSDPEKKQKLFEMVVQLHGGILEIDSDTLDMAARLILTDAESYQFWLDNKHNYFGQSAEVFKLFEKKPEQKSLVKHKVLNLRGMKKQKTPNQHLTAVHSAKYLTKELLALQEFRKNQEELNRRQELINIKLNLRLLRLEEDVGVLDSYKNILQEYDIEEGTEVYKKINEMYTSGVKHLIIKAYILKSLHKELTLKELSEMLNLHYNTILNYNKFLRENYAIDLSTLN